MKLSINMYKCGSFWVMTDVDRGKLITRGSKKYCYSELPWYIDKLTRKV